MQVVRAITLAASLISVVALTAGCGGGDDLGAATVTTTTIAPPSSVTTTRLPATTPTAPTSTSATTTRSPATTAVATTIARADIKAIDWLATLKSTPGFSVDTTSPSTSAK